MEAALIWHDNTPARVARSWLDLGAMHLMERRLGIVLDAVHEPDRGGGSGQRWSLAG